MNFLTIEKFNHSHRTSSVRKIMFAVFILVVLLIIMAALAGLIAQSGFDVRGVQAAGEFKTQNQLTTR